MHFFGQFKDHNGTRTHNHLVRKRKLNHLAKLACHITYAFQSESTLYSLNMEENMEARQMTQFFHLLFPL